MNLSFAGRGARWSGTAGIAEKGEKDKHQPYRALVRPEGGDEIEGFFLVTDLAATAATERGDADAQLAAAFGRALTAELAMRRLAPGFRFVLDHRWVTGYERPPEDTT